MRPHPSGMQAGTGEVQEGGWDECSHACLELETWRSLWLSVSEAQ